MSLYRGLSETVHDLSDTWPRIFVVQQRLSEGFQFYAKVVMLRGSLKEEIGVSGMPNTRNRNSAHHDFASYEPRKRLSLLQSLSQWMESPLARQLSASEMDSNFLHPLSC